MLGDMRFALRQLKRSPVATVMVVLTLALAIGANTAIFSVVKGILLNQLPYRNPEQLVKIAVAAPDMPVPQTIDFTTTYDLRARSKSFESMSLFRDGDVAIVEQGRPELLEGLRVSYDYFDTLGAKMKLGRSFLAEEDQPETRYARPLATPIRRRPIPRRPLSLIEWQAVQSGRHLAGRVPSICTPGPHRTSRNLHAFGLRT